MDSISRLSRTVSFSMVNPGLTDRELMDGCLLAKEYRVGSIVVLPCFIADSVLYLKKTGIKVSAVIGTGGSTTAIKVYESEEACRYGAKEIELTINVGKLLSGDIIYIEQEIAVLVAIAKYYKSLLTVSLDYKRLISDEVKIAFYQLCSRLKVNFIKIYTGILIADNPTADHWDASSIVDDLILIGNNTSTDVQIVAEGNIRTANQFFQIRKLGVSRIYTSYASTMLNEVKKQFLMTTK